MVFLVKNIGMFFLSFFLYFAANIFYISQYNIYPIFLIYTLIMVTTYYKGFYFFPAIIGMFIYFYEPIISIYDMFTLLCIIYMFFISNFIASLFKYYSRIQPHKREVYYMIFYVVIFPLLYNFFYYGISEAFYVNLNVFKLEGALISLYFSDVFHSLTILPIFFVIYEFYVNKSKIKLEIKNFSVVYYVPVILILMFYLLYPLEKYKDLILILFIPAAGFFVGFKGQIKSWFFCSLISIGIYILKCQQLNNNDISVYEFNSSILYLVVINLFLFLLLIKGSFYKNLLLKQKDRLKRDPVTKLKNINCLLDDCKNLKSLTLIEINFQSFFTNYTGVTFNEKVSIFNAVSKSISRRYLSTTYLSPSSSGLLIYFKAKNFNPSYFINDLSELVKNTEVSINNQCLNPNNVIIKGMEINTGENGYLIDNISTLCDSISIPNIPIWINENSSCDKFEELFYSKSLISNEHLEIYFQVYKANLSDDLYGEVLTRVVHKDKVESIYKYFPMMGDLGLFITMDFIVIEKVFKLINEYSSKLTGVGYISLNVSTQSLSSEGFVDKIKVLINQYNIDTSKFCFEVSESDICLDSRLYVENINGLRELGAKVAIDDLGAGYSGFSYLKQLPYDVVKFDGEFIRNIITNKNDYAIVKAINSFCLDMGKETVAEFVETGEQAELLGELGITYFQGYWVAKPILFKDVLDQHVNNGN